MANHSAGVGATVSGVSHTAPDGPASKEKYVYGILAKLEGEDNSLTRLPERVVLNSNGKLVSWNF